MKYNVCVVEDDDVTAALFIDILNRYFTNRHIDFRITHYATGVAFLDDFREKYVVPDILFMDIYLPEMNGIDVCHEIRSSGFAGDILIMTGSTKHMLDGYDVDARGYILKPYEPERIKETLDRVLRYATIRTYPIQNRAQTIRIPVSEISFIESKNTRCIIHCGSNNIYTIYKKLDVVETELGDRHFLRCHKSYLVNMDSIDATENTHFVLHNGEQVPIRAKDAKAIRQQYIDFVTHFD